MLIEEDRPCGLKQHGERGALDVKGAKSHFIAVFPHLVVGYLDVVVCSRAKMLDIGLILASPRPEPY